jgi:hypothetical protein
VAGPSPQAPLTMPVASDASVSPGHAMRRF